MRSLFIVLTAGSLPAFAASCESLASLSLPNTTITLAQSVAPGGFAPPASFSGTLTPGAPAYKDLPAFCRIAATLKPSSDSDIKIEVWLPASDWNGKFIGAGNGGWAGRISYALMISTLARGYAVASTDTGHDAESQGGGGFAFGHPEKLVDFAWRSEHELTVKAKAIIAEYYGRGPRLSYWNGCSTGGKQGLKEAQRFPDDFDGIIAGAPANYWTHLMAQFMWSAQAVHKDEASYITPSEYSLIHSAVLQACDVADGVRDGVIEDPTRCKFDPKVLECKGADNAGCLTAPQAEAARKIYSAAVNPRTHQQIFPGLAPGSELGWAGHAGPQPFQISFDHFKYVVFKDPNWDYQTFNFDSHVALTDQIDNGLINATDPNLKAFFAHRGKLLQYHGWSDPLISPQNSVDYYQRVADTLGGVPKIDSSYRLFMVPGMAHCSGGEGPDTFDAMTALDQWVEQGKAPERIIASKLSNGKTERSRPLCPYPQTAVYRGSGSTDDPANFVCKAQ